MEAVFHQYFVIKVAFGFQLLGYQISWHIFFIMQAYPYFFRKEVLEKLHATFERLVDCYVYLITIF